LFRFEPPHGVTVHVCDDVPCRLRGAGSLLQALEARCGPPRRFMGESHGVPAREAPVDKRTSPVDWETVPCLGQCDHAPVAVVSGRLEWEATPEGILASAVRGATRA
jgi:NADH:ubiquinone oxidoreductase subunit E